MPFKASNVSNKTQHFEKVDNNVLGPIFLIFIWKNLAEQESIPVGCVLPACQLYVFR